MHGWPVKVQLFHCPKRVPVAFLTAPWRRRADGCQWDQYGPVEIGGYIRLTTNDLGAKTRSFYQAFHVHIAVHEFKMLPSVDRKSRPVSLSLQPRLGVSSRNPCNHEGITQDVYKESIGEG